MLSVRRAAALLSSAAAVFACSAASASADIGGFEGADGNRACVIATDWDCAAASGWKVTVKTDATGSADDVFISSAKEQQPDTWAFTSGSANTKTDLLDVSSATRETADAAYLALAFDVTSAGSSASAGFELNQTRRTFKNAQGVDVTCRTDGDVLVSYALPNSVSLYKWAGASGPASCPGGGSGTWKAVTTPADVWEAKSLDTFGETVLDLGAVAAAVQISKPCSFFGGLQTHSRQSGSSPTSSLSDYVADAAIGVAACKPPEDPDGGDGGTGQPVATPTVTAATSCGTGAVTLTGSAPGATQVQVLEGAGSVGVADVTDGAWTLTLTGVADGAHSYTAVARDGVNAPSAASAPAGATVAACALPPGDTGTTPNGGSTPAGGVLGTTASGAGAVETEITSDTTPSCATKPFGISIPAKRVKRVVFRVDGKAVKTVRKASKGKFRLTIDPTKFKVGAHKITAKVTLRNGKTRIVPMRAFARCVVGQCVSRRAFRIHAKKLHGDRIVRATVYVNGKKAGAMKGTRLSKGLDLRGLPQGKVTVVIKGVTAKGRHVKDVRHYKTCTKKGA